MSSPLPVLAPTERIVWKGERKNIGCSDIFTLGGVFACLILAAAFTSILSGFAYKVTAALVCLFVALRAISEISRTRTSYILTNHRVIELDREGRSLWRDGSPLARVQEAKIRHRLCGQIVKVNTVQWDHGDPEEVHLGPLKKTDARTLVKLLQSLANDPGSQAW